MSYVLQPGQVSPDFLRYSWASPSGAIEWVADASVRVTAGVRLSKGVAGEKGGKPGIRFETPGGGRTVFVESEGRPEIARLIALAEAGVAELVARVAAMPSPKDDGGIVDDGFFIAMSGNRNGWNNPRHDDR